MRMIGARAALGLALAGVIAGTAPAEAETRGERRAGAMVVRVDANGDGTVSLSEFTARAKARIAELDKNGDGALSREEARAFRPHEGARRWR